MQQPTEGKSGQLCHRTGAMERRREARIESVTVRTGPRTQKAHLVSQHKNKPGFELHRLLALARRELPRLTTATIALLISKATTLIHPQAIRFIVDGLTTIVIAHRLSTVRKADRVVVMDQGAMVESGTHNALMRADGLYRRPVSKESS